MARKNHNLGDQSIVINVDDYVDHLYIHYKTQTASHLSGYTKEIFDKKKEDALKNARGEATEAQLQAMVQSMNSQTSVAQSTGRIIDSLQNKDLLERTLESIADFMNQSIEESYQGFNYSETIENAHSTYNSLLVREKNETTNKSLGAETANAFFNEIEEALHLINEDMTTQEKNSFEALKKVFATGTGWTKDLAVVSKKSVSTASQVIKLLNSAAKKLSKDGELSQASFASTITQIFSTVIGEELSRQMIENTMYNILQVADNTIINGLTKIPNGKVEGKLTGTSYSKSRKEKKTAKVDVAFSKVFSLAAQLLGGNVLNIDIGTDMSVKWQQGKSNTIHLVGGTKLTTIFDQMQLDNNAKHAAYNVITHRHTPNWLDGSAMRKNQSLEEAYRSIKSSVAGCFFTEWITGSGNMLSSGGIDKAQFLMYNGKIYSVLTIIKRICESKNGVGTDIVGVTKLDNRFIEEGGVKGKVAKEKMSDYWATERSKDVMKVINTLTIAGTLNKNILLNYIT